MDNINEKSDLPKLEVNVFECNNVIVEEVESEVDGKHVLAKVKGEFFVPDGTSRNGRFYPKSLWEKVLNDDRINTYLEKKKMFGTISHEQALDDKALLEGKISHIVTGLNINENNKGIGEVLILDTPAGRILNTIFRAGGTLYVSSRARGSYLRGKRHEGMPIVDPDNYFLETFDFVLDPGFLEAQPQLVESINKIIEAEQERINAEKQNNDNKENTNLEGELHMSNENKNLLKDLTEEKDKIKSQLGTALEEVETLKSDNAVQADEISHLKEELEKLKNVDKVLKEYKELGTVAEIEKALSESEEKIDSYKELGSVEAITKVFDQLEELGTIPQITEAMDVLENKVKAYEELGSPEQIGEAFDIIEQKQAEIKAQEEAKLIADLAKEFGVSEKKISALWDKMSVDQIREFFADEDQTPAPAAEPVVANKNERFKKPANTPAKTDDKPSSLSEKLRRGKRDENRKSPFETPLAERLIKKFS